MVDARSGHTASLLPDGRILLAGGQNSGGAINNLEIFDRSSGNFSGAGVMTSARMKHAAVSLQDGRVLLVGGFDGTNPLASSDIFDHYPLGRRKTTSPIWSSAIWALVTSDCTWGLRGASRRLPQ
jgi:Galactose oxidase, central domain